MVTRSIFPETELPRTHLRSARKRKILAACLHTPQKVAREVSLRSRAVTKTNYQNVIHKQSCWLLNLLIFGRFFHRRRDHLRSLVSFLFSCKVTFLAGVRRVTGWSLIRWSCRRINLDYFQSISCEVTKLFIIIHCVSQFSKSFIFGDSSFKIHHERDYHTTVTVKNKEKG